MAATPADFTSAITRIEAAVQAVLANFGNLQGFVTLAEEAITKLHDLATQLEGAVASTTPPAPPPA